jgi:hypothetical protein
MAGPNPIGSWICLMAADQNCKELSTSLSMSSMSMWWHLDSRNLAGVQSQAVSNHRPQGLLSFFHGINLAIHTSISIYIIYQGSVWIWCQRIQRMMIVMIIFKHQRPRTSPMRPSRPPGCIETRWVAVATDLFPIWSAAPAASGQRRNDDHSFWCCFQPILLVWELI